MALVGYTLSNQLVPAPAWPYSLFPYVTLVWLAAGAGVVVFAPQMARKIGQGLARSLGLPALGSEPRDAAPPEQGTESDATDTVRP